MTLSASANGGIGWTPFRHPLLPLVCRFLPKFGSVSILPSAPDCIGGLSWVLFSPRHRVRPDVLPACDPVSREDTKTHDPSIPKDLCPAFPPSPEASPLLAHLTSDKP